MARRVWRYGLLGIGAVVVLAACAGAVVVARFDPDSLKPRIEAAVQQATGRDLSLNGRISLKWSLWPTVVLRDVAFANPAGYSRPQMATFDRLELQLAVLPLLRRQFEIARLVLVHPDILLEKDAQGAVNWRLTPQPGAAPEASGGAPGTGTAPGRHTSSGGKASTAISFHDVQIEDGTLAWRDDRKGRTDAIALKQLLAKSAAPDAPLTLTVDAIYNGIGFKLGGAVGPLDRLQQPDADTPWPLKLTLAAAGATVAIDGAITHPLQGRGYRLTLDGTIPDLAAIAPLLRNSRLPPLHDVHLAAQIADSGGRVPRVEAATLHLGPADLDAYVSGLHVVSVDIDAPKQDQPVRINAQATLADTPLSLVAIVGVPGAMTTGGPGAPPQVAEPVPLDLTLQAANASLSLKGIVAHPDTLSGADLAVAATIPDLSLLSPLAHRRLPAVTQIAFQGRLTDPTGGFRHGAALHDARLTSAAGDLSGDIAVADGPPRSVTGKLHASRIDADALLAAAGKPVTGPAPLTNGGPPAANGVAPPGADSNPGSKNGASLPAANGASLPATNGASLPATNGASRPAANGASPAGANGASPAGANGASPSGTRGAPSSARGGASPGAGLGGAAQSVPNGTVADTASNAAAAAGSAAPEPAGGGRLFPDTPIPFGLLRQADADLALSVDDLTSSGADYRSIELHVVLQDGKLRLAPASAELPEGRLDGSLDVDATAAAPPVAVTLHAPGLPVAPLLSAAGLPGYASGKLEIYADLHGSGATPHAIAAGLDGSLGLAMQNGTIDMALLQRLLGPVLQRANLLGMLSHGGSSDLRCFALRADVQQGVAELRALELNSSALSMDGTGSVNLGEETLAVRLRPQGRLGRTVIVVPMQATGAIRSPSVKVNAFGAAESNAGSVAGAVAGSVTPLGLLGGMLGGGKLADSGTGDSCAGPLAVARGETAPEPAPGNQGKPKPSVSGALLHDLFR